MTLMELLNVSELTRNESPMVLAMMLRWGVGGLLAYRN